MTLVVSTFWDNPDTGAREEFTDWENGRYMAGVERARSDLWGSEAVKRRGATFLPRLARENLWVSYEELDAFEAEVAGLLADLGDLHAELDYRSETLAHYLENFRHAIERARGNGGGVCIE